MLFLEEIKHEVSKDAVYWEEDAGIHVYLTRKVDD